MRCAVLLILTLSACVDFPEGKGVQGSPDDVTTMPGDQGNYRVIAPCTGADYGVIGGGSVKLRNTTAIANAARDLHAELAAIPSIIGGGGVGLVCTPGVVGTSVELDDWRDVDAVIAMTGEFLHSRDLGLEVAISVRGAAVAQ